MGVVQLQRGKICNSNPQHTAHGLSGGQSQKCGFTGMVHILNPAQQPLLLKILLTMWIAMAKCFRGLQDWQYMVATRVVRKHGSSF